MRRRADRSALPVRSRRGVVGGARRPSEAVVLVCVARVRGARREAEDGEGRLQRRRRRSSTRDDPQAAAGELRCGMERAIPRSVHLAPKPLLRPTYRSLGISLGRRCASDTRRGAGEPGLQAQDRLRVQLGDARLGHAEHLADLAQGQLLVVVERDDELLPLRAAARSRRRAPRASRSRRARSRAAGPSRPRSCPSARSGRPRPRPTRARRARRSRSGRCRSATPRARRRRSRSWPRSARRSARGRSSPRARRSRARSRGRASGPSAAPSRGRAARR